VLATATWGEGGGQGGPHIRQNTTTGGGFMPAIVVNDGNLGSSLRSGSRIGMQMGTHWVFVGQLHSLFALL
jgi:hypothetical protein